MIKTLALYIFGWRRMSERFAARWTGYIPAYLRDHEAEGAEKLSDACLSALSHLAYQRAKKREDLEPRVIHYFREMDSIASSVEAALSGRDVRDERVRVVLGWHRVLGEPIQSPQTTRAFGPRV
jgi:hypothetical protein